MAKGSTATFTKNAISAMGDVEASAGPRPARQMTLYDVVAGRAGLNGFLTAEQQETEASLPMLPEEILHGKSTVPGRFVDAAYADADDVQLQSTKLPDSEILKAIHAHVSDFYSVMARDEGKFDFKSLDETALLAMGVLLEEAVREALGASGDMVFVEPDGLDKGLPEAKMTKHQISGKVKPSRMPEVESADESENSLKDDESPSKKQRR